MPKYLNNVDLAKNQLLNVRLQNLAAAPSAPVAGQIYFDTVLVHSYIYTGAGWEQASGSGSSGTVTTVSVVTANGLAGTVSTPGSTPTITLSTTVVGLVKGDGTAFLAAAGSDLPSLDTITAPAGDLSLNSHKIINLADPTLAQDATTKKYVDTTVQGLQVKPTARVATTAALSSNTYNNGTSGVGATLTATANGALTVDGVTVAVSDLILVKNEATASHNGLYTVTQTGDGSTPYILTRHADMDQGSEFPGAFIPVGNSGTTNANSLWLANPTGAVTVGTTAIPLTQLNGATDLIPGSGIAISGNTISLVATVPRKYQTTLGDGSTTSFIITQATHGLASDSSLLVQVMDDSTGSVVFTDITINKANGAVTVNFTTAPTTNAYRVVIIG